MSPWLINLIAFVVAFEVLNHIWGLIFIHVILTVELDEDAYDPLNRWIMLYVVLPSVWPVAWKFARKE